MSEYALADFQYSLDRAGIHPRDIKRVALAWGRNGDYAEWSGGFVCEMNDGRWACIEGGCDKTGWGCQDGASAEFSDAQPETKPTYEDWRFSERSSETVAYDLDENPADLNTWLAKWDQGDEWESFFWTGCHA